MRLILSYFAAHCNAPRQSHPASPTLSLLTTLPAAVQESATSILERDWHQDILVMVRERLPKVAVVLLILFVLQRLVSFATGRLSHYAGRQSISRAAQFRTMATLIRTTAYGLLGTLAFLQLLKLANIDYEPLLASAGILGVGIGLAAQSLFKDIINGIFILLEDQYNVGEIVKIAGLQGTVEALTFRSTRLRDGDGTLHLIPNSQIATVSNLSRDFSVASLPVSVDASANPDHVLRTLATLAASLRDDPAFKDVFLEPPTTPGIDKIDGRTILYPINMRLRPNSKDPVLRELRRRIVDTFEKEGIPLGTDGSMLVMQSKADPTAPPAQQPLVGS